MEKCGEIMTNNIDLPKIKQICICMFLYVGGQ
jgi:hypothetical protein